jgi:hypothetical protein
VTRRSLVIVCAAASIAAVRLITNDPPPTDARLVAVTEPPAAHRADAGQRTYTFRVGPYDIGGYQAVSREAVVSPPPVSGHVTAMDARIVDLDGKEVPQHELMLHHVVFTNGGTPGRSRTDAACPGRLPERFFGTSEELRPLTLPRGYGYRIGADDNWTAAWMLMNHQDRRRRVMLEYRVTVDRDRSLRPVTPMWLGVTSCDTTGDPQYTVPGGAPGGAEDVRSRAWRMPFNGRVVAIGGHLHGGGKALSVAQPRCGDRTLFSATAIYADAGDPLYRVRPMLHEPDPETITWFQSPTGWRVNRGEELRVTAAYDAERPHMRVMGIAHVYVAADPPFEPAPACEPAPRDATVLDQDAPGRRAPPPVSLRLATDPARPPSALAGDALVRVRAGRFDRPAISIPRHATVTWRFEDQVPHDATLVSGPVGFASPSSAHLQSWSREFDVPGRYEIHCSLHPTAMSQYVEVRG